MKKFYVITCLLLIGALTVQELQAQKTLRIRISNVYNNPGTDCDGVLNNSDWEWQFNTTGSDPCIERDNNSANNYDPNVTVFGTNTYYSRNCWPTGNFTIGFRAFEDDGTGNCDGECGIGYTNTSRAYKAWNSGNGTWTDWSNITRTTSCNCPTTITYRYSAQQIVGGSNFNAQNLTDGYVNNTTACSARNMGSGTGFGATGNYATQCNTTWYYYDLTANSNTLYINPSQNGSTVNVYYSSNNSCSNLCWRASGGGAATVRGAPAGRYYFSLSSSGGGNTNIAISRTGATHDNVQFATTITPNYSATVNNSSYTEQSSEPNPAGDIYNTWWYTFVTPAGGYPFVSASISENGGNNSAVAIYRDNGNACNGFGKSLTHLASDRWCASSGGTVSTNCLAGNTRYYVQYGTASNFALCVGGENTGSYNISINTGAPGGPDFICSPHNFNTIGNGYDSGNIYYNNSCLSTSSGEPRTGNMSHTMWYKFRTPANGLESVTVDVEEAGEGANYLAVALYEDADFTCGYSGMTERAFDRWCASSGGNISYNCLAGNKDFYIQLGTGYNFAACTDLLNGGRSTGRYRLRLTSSSYAIGPDNICSATTNFTINSTSGSTSINNQSNICAGTESGEPGGGQKTVWYRFTTGATVPYNFNITMDAKTNGLNSDVYVYEACSGCSFSGLTELDNFFDVNPLPGEWDASGTISGKIKPNSTYYIRADGTATVGVDGGFDLDMSWNGTFNGNDNFCNATNLGTLANGGTLTLNNFNNYSASTEEQCALNEPNVDSDDETVWVKFTTNANPDASIEIDVSADGGTGQGGACVAGEIVAGWIKVYEADGSPALPANCSGWTTSTNWFNGIVEAANVTTGIDVSDVTMICAKPNTTYWVQVETGGLATCDKAQFDIVITGDGYSKGPDDLCDATFQGTLNGLTASDLINNQSNECATTESGEFGGGQQTVWYYFTTGATVGYDFNINMDAQTNGLNSDIYVYELCNSACTGSTPNWSNLVEIDNFFDVNPLPGEWDAGGTISGKIKANTTYYIRADGTATVGEDGGFDITYSFSGGAPNGNDDFCNATDLGTLATGGSLSATNFNNYTASAEESCSLNEPNVDSDDETVWFKFTTGANPGTIINVDVSADGGTGQGGACVAGEIVAGWVKVYVADGSPALPATCAGWTTGTNWFNGIVEPTVAIGIDVSDLEIECPLPNTTYWVQVETGGLSTCDKAQFDLVIDDNGHYGSNDDLCEAYDLGTITNGQLVQSGSGGVPAVFSTECATKEANEPEVDLSEGSHQEASVWFKFTVDDNAGLWATGAMWDIWAENVDIALDEFIHVNLYEDPANCATLSDLIIQDNKEDEAYYANDVLCIANGVTDLVPRTRIYGCLEPGKTYYIQVYVDEVPDLGLADEQGAFSIHIQNSRTVPKNNDDFANSTLIPAIAGATLPPNNVYGAITTMLEENNLCAGTESFESSGSAGPNITVESLEHTVWYRFVAPASGSVQFQLTNSATSTDGEKDIEEEISVFRQLGGTPTNPTLQAEYHYSSKVDVPVLGSIFEDGEITWDDYAFVTCLTPGATYYVRVDGDYDAISGYCPGDAMRGVFDLQVRDYDIWPSTNDFCQDARDIMTAGTGATLAQWRTCYQSHTITLDQQDNYCADNVNEAFSSPWSTQHDQTVWYSFEAPPSGKLKFELENELDCGIFGALADGDLKPYIDLRAAVYDLVGDCSDIPTVNADAALNLLHSEERVVALSCASVFGQGINREFEVECLTPGRTYYLLVDGRPGGFTQENDYKFGEFEIRITSDPRDAPAPNNLLCDAEYLGNPDSGPVTSSDLRPRSAPYACMRAENNFCADNSGDPEPSDPWPIGFDVDQGVWYTFTAPSTGEVEILVENDPNSIGDQIFPQSAVFTLNGAPCTASEDSFSIVSHSQVAAFSDLIYRAKCLDPGEIYHVLVDGNGLNTEGYFEITITEVAATETPPANDNICSATATTPFSGPVSLSNQTNRCALTEPAVPTPTAFGKDRTVWYSFTTPNGVGPYAVDVSVTSQLPWPFGDAVDPQLALYYDAGGNSCSGTLTELDSDWDVFPPFLESFEFHCLLPNTTYWLMMDGSVVNYQGNFSIDLTSITPNPIAANDDICSVVSAATGDLGTLGTTAGSTLGSHAPGNEWNNFCSDTESGEPVGDAFIDGIQQTVWFKFVIPDVPGTEAIDVTIDANNDPNNVGDQIDLQIAVYTTTNDLCSGGTFTEMASDYDVIPWSEDLTVCLPDNETYWIQIDGGVNRQGYFTLVVSNDGPAPTPSNDKFCNAQLLTVGTTRTNENNLCASVESYEPGAGVDIQQSVWYKFVAPTSGRVNIDINNASPLLFIPEWKLYDYDAGCVAGGIDASGSFAELQSGIWPLESQDYECLFPGRTYYIQVDGVKAPLAPTEGTFDIVVTDLHPNYTTTIEPANNACANAIDLTSTIQANSCQFEGGSWGVDRNYGQATRSMYTVPCGTNCGDTWYKFTMPPELPGCEPLGYSFVKVEGLDDAGLFGLFDTELQVIAYRGTCGGLTMIKCDAGGNGDDVDFSLMGTPTIGGTPGETIYLQVFSNNGNVDDNEDFKLCLSQRKAPDDCLDAVTIGDLELNTEYCWDVRDATPDNLPTNGYEVNSNAGAAQNLHTLSLKRIVITVGDMKSF